jgi:hypothetical protein
MALLGGGRYANITATLALVISLGGVGYAATSIPKNSVGSKQIKNGAIKAKDLKAGVIPTVPAPGSRAYAQLNPDGSVEHSKGITAANITLGGNSLYCIDGLGFTPQVVQATPVFDESNGKVPEVAVRFGPNGNTGCDDTTQVIAITHTDTGANVRQPLMIQID